jgi:hypothetical protein
MMARPPPATMTKEYQEMTNEYLKVRISLAEHFPYEMLFLELGRV